MKVALLGAGRIGRVHGTVMAGQPDVNGGDVGGDERAHRQGIDPNGQWARPRPAQIGSTEEEEA